MNVTTLPLRTCTDNLPAQDNSGGYRSVADPLSLSSATKEYYAVFQFNGKTKWIPLDTTGRKLAGRCAKMEIAQGW